MMVAKAKTQNQHPFTLSSLWQQEFEFVSPLPVDECANLLFAKSERGSGFLASRRKLLVEMTGYRGDHYDFRMQRSFGKNTSIEVKGHLRRWDDTSTLVTGDAMSDRWQLILAVLVAPIVIYMDITIWGGLLPVVFVSLIMLFSIGQMFVLRQQMIRIVYDTLSDQIY